MAKAQVNLVFDPSARRPDQPPDYSQDIALPKIAEITAVVRARARRVADEAVAAGVSYLRIVRDGDVLRVEGWRTKPPDADLPMPWEKPGA